MKQKTSIIAENHICVSFTVLFLFSVLFFLSSIQAFTFYFSYLSQKMALSRADIANHRKPGQHCLAVPYIFCKVAEASLLPLCMFL